MTFFNSERKIFFKGFGRRKLILVAVVLLAITAVAAYFLSPTVSEMVHQSETTAVPESQLYTCAMHPQIVQDKPGQCPICGMDLVPLKSFDEKHHHHDDGEHAEDDPAEKPLSEFEIKVAPSVLQKSGFRTEILKKQKIKRELRTIAHIDYDETGDTVINARVNGWVEKLYARYTGKTVKRGEALAGIYSPELVATQEEYLQLHRSMKELGESAELKRLLAAAKRRLEYWNISREQIAALEKRGSANRLLILSSPYSGVIVEKQVVEGAQIKEGMNLFRIVNLSTVWAYMHIPEKDIPFVQTGMPATMSVSQIPGKEFKGKVSFIFPFMDEKSRDLKVRVSFQNHGYELKPGMYATVVLTHALPGEHVVAPSSAIIRTGEREIAFVYKGNGVLEPRELHTGVSTDNDGIQILHGLKEGEAIVVSGQFLLDSETRIQEAVRKLRAGDADMKSMPGGHNH